MTTRNIIITELDGIISDDRWRIPYLDAEGWDAYYAPMNMDSIFPDTWQLLRLVEEQTRMVIITARPEKYRQMTMGWLRSHEVEADDLVMRPDNCFEKSFLVKMKQLEEKLGFDWAERTLMAIDHSPNMLEAYRERGVTTMEIIHRQLETK